MNIFDLHCDTAHECLNRNLDLSNDVTVVNLERLTGTRTQCFAAFIPDRLDCEAAYSRYCAVRDWLNNQLRLYPDRIVRYGENGGAGVLLTVENGSALGGRPERVWRLYDDGVRMMSLTWNGQNELAGGAATDGDITELGLQCIDNMLACGMHIDVSHLSDRGFDRLMDMGVPVVASHSLMRSVCDHRRNLTDRQFAYIRDCGGVVGLNFYCEFLGGKGDFDALYGHIYHALSLGGEDTLAIGSDYDGARINSRLCDKDCFDRLADYLDRRDIDSNKISKIFSDNAARLFAADKRSVDHELQQYP